ncbi:3-carboxy-cis,cis-muconate cycloisomerase [Mangrovihabitans endophyticus]|uniref:3-carboxy-cis,cis-muconate cycloisomerase n=1 Tax=Mangrovihabitans endophyticus TaxID=1751298 RepID=A0A8J3BZN8_9ACTN|nr:3-carboxy-cis,cis-muconate cycloisomerase [Mangrovihabitans endophyticus]GGK97588.1 3-carboxy-cis,cis-muconate cycloisomerase [Mangrovihabitans endophyticus]
MKPSSSHSDLFGDLLAAGPVRAAVDDQAWIRALLDAEAGLARAGATAGVVPETAAEAIASVCAETTVDPAELGASALGAGNPVVPLVRLLRAALPADAARHVHRGATSQDIMDTATMLIARDALAVLDRELADAVGRCAALADGHRRTLLPARTLLQQALPTTFGLVAAGWLTALADARRRLARLRPAVQLGGAAGTLAAYRDCGPAMVSAYAEGLGLAEPVLPWHTDRARIAELAAALGIAAGAAGKVAGDIVRHAQTEVGELREGGDAGGSSTLPQKHNPIRAVLAVAAAEAAPGLVATLLSAMAQEHQRAAGAWHAEWRPLRALFEAAGSAVHQVGASLDGLQVDADRMRANVDRTGGALLAERVTAVLADRLGADQAHAVVREAAAAPDFAAALAADARVPDAAGLLAPEDYLGSADVLIDRALKAAS